MSTNNKICFQQLGDCQPKTYVVFVGRVPGVYERWSEASEQVCGFSGSCYKGYETKTDAEEAFRSFSQAADGTRVHEKCECQKTSTCSTSRTPQTKNSQKLVKVLRDLAIEIHDHAVRMEKVVEEIGQILEDMQLDEE
ncbi:proton pump-interactor 1-like [Dorcoceras hygrometricum]|uniref:Proton pump-interactor 1-like n=1 Tax=Dorcoceras hygrometricum TaxID=472368 RepID=A0A2Z7DD54_9LAMI|nr:proton pump-interactor 1-like [Dorcoceras hygrometricum]